MKDYRLTVKVRNNRILEAIEAVGGTPGGKWCGANGLSYTQINDLINMTISPLAANGSLSESADRLCEVLGKLPDELWSSDQIRPLERNFSEMGMDYAQIVAFLPGAETSYLPDFSGIENEQREKAINCAIESLSSAERDVIRLRFFEGMTLDAASAVRGVTRMRIRQIESKALQKLRHPSRSKLLVDFVNN